MAARTSIINASGDHEENIERLAKHLGKNKMRRRLFNTVYGPGTRPRSLKQIMKAAGISDRHRQQAQNQIDHLAKHHLIVGEDNNGTVPDGSRRIYSKDGDFVRANRAEIIKYADHPASRRKIATKRRPLVSGVQVIKTVTKAALRKKRHLNILYLAADPIKNNPLRVDVEIHNVQNEIRGSKLRDNITIHLRPAANLNSVLRGLNDLNPQIVHFSGHGNKTGVAMDNASIVKPAVEMVSFKLLAKALAATKRMPQVVVLNACESAGARNLFLKLGLIVISMRRSISDLAAAEFAVQFYGALASGQPVKFAFEQGRIAVEAKSISEANTPLLACPKNVDPSKIILA